MRKLTRKSYRRKRILLGVAIFLSVALIATGFGAFVLSSEQKVNQGGNVEVGTLTDSSLGITLTSDKTQSFRFDAADGDILGRVQMDATKPEEIEKLAVTVSGLIDGVDYLQKLTVELVIKDEAEKAQIDAAISAGYIVAPECYGQAVSIIDLLDFDPSITDPTEKNYFTYEVKFKWGSTFGEMNPSLYFDLPENAYVKEEDGSYSGIEDLTVEKMLGDFYKKVYGATDYATGSANGSAPKFEIVITASASTN